MRKSRTIYLTCSPGRPPFWNFNVSTVNSKKYASISQFVSPIDLWNKRHRSLRILINTYELRVVWNYFPDFLRGGITAHVSHWGKWQKKIGVKIASKNAIWIEMSRFVPTIRFRTFIHSERRFSASRRPENDHVLFCICKRRLSFQWLPSSLPSFHSSNFIS